MYSCFHSVGLPKNSLIEVIKLVSEAGYSALELNAENLPWAPPHITPEADRATRDRIKIACRSQQLSIPAIGAHIPMLSPDVSKREKAIDYVIGCIDLAYDVGAPIVHILSGLLEPNCNREEAWHWFRTAVEMTTEYATKKNRILGVEAIAGHVFHKVDDYHQLRRELPGVPFKINFDPSHLEVQGENPKRIVDELADLVVHVHLKDGKGIFPNFEFPPLGRGTIEFGELIDELRNAGYEGALSVEYEAQVFGYTDTEMEILNGGKAFADRLISLASEDLKQ